MSASVNRAQEIVDTIKYLTIATVDTEGKPWNAPVFGMCDEDFTCYWGSYIGTQHSRNIESNNNVYIVIYDSTCQPGTGEGVYIRATAEKVEQTEEIRRIYELMKSRHDGHFWPLEALSDDGPIRFYRAIKQQVWMNDDGEKDGVYIDVRKQLI